MREREEGRERGREGGSEGERRERERGRKSDGVVEVEKDGMDGGQGRLLVDPLVT